jgi:hypothetical protein
MGSSDALIVNPYLVFLHILVIGLMDKQNHKGIKASLQKKSSLDVDLSLISIYYNSA